ncbi:MAG TPA: heme ABC exporter ATP-binding protein CcmA [Acidobacteriaceae bacterium]|jgi:heme ABC exporter ATP-binding subunit CcmA|nr:heme ABC exporter ATP-binding protein CcmA [Acidobacteriaceae bacterium]
MSAPVATVQDVSKLYGRFAALRHVSVTFGPARCYLLLGENGAGKSTLLRVLAGLLRPTLGTVRVLERPAAEARGRIGYMSHAAMLYDELTARENLEYTAKLYADQPCLSPDQALRMVGLDPALTRPVGQYSQGMRQRTSLARVLLSQPELLLLDEPFSNMDRASAERMLALLAELRGAGRTIVLTTHQRELAEPMADVVLMMQSGALTAAETA